MLRLTRHPSLRVASPVAARRVVAHGATAVAIAALTVAATRAPVGAQVLTQDEALELAFPGDEVERRTAYLTDDQLARATEEAGPDVEVETGIVTYYVAIRGDRPVGVAYFDVHRVRTVTEVLMIVVDPNDRIRRVETIRFSEPPKYQAPDGWLRQFDGQGLDEELSLKGEIANITGATLTAGAVTRSTRRALALHHVIAPFGETP